MIDTFSSELQIIARLPDLLQRALIKRYFGTKHAMCLACFGGRPDRLKLPGRRTDARHVLTSLYLAMITLGN